TAGDLNSLRNSRLLTSDNVSRTKSSLKPDGVLYVMTEYDTDRYVNDDIAGLLSVLNSTLRLSFDNVSFWPGTRTLIFASDAPLEALDENTLASRIAGLAYMPVHVNDYLLYDRFEPLKTERLEEALQSGAPVHSLDRPVLNHLHAAWQSHAFAVDRFILGSVLGASWWLMLLPLAVAVCWVLSLRGKSAGRQYGLFLYFTAGVSSLALELIGFYVYQSTVGSLYSELAVLIGVFMLGLAAGTWVTVRWTNDRSGISALIVLIGAAVLYLGMFDRVHPNLLLVFHLLFFFTTALGTGSLFVFATRRYYGRSKSNRGLGYAVELAGSALGALVTTTLLLPRIGLRSLMWWIIGLLVLALAGAVISLRREPVARV
ncbi:MAG: hypothetical protein KKA42_06375, partial [candidate division Zixibacteria bacterium]|nr:hypothetical protein [candidate division Zixibacteria bacterium]